MLILRCTTKLQKRLRITPVIDPPISQGVLGDWSCNLLYLGKTQLIVCVNHLTRLPIFVTAANGRQFPNRLQQTLNTVLTLFDIPSTQREQACEPFNTVVFSKTNDRSVTGSLNDFGQMATYYEIGNDPADLINISLHFANTPCKPIQYQSPKEAVQKLFKEARG